MPVCTLPSSETACRIVHGDIKALPNMFRDTAMRGLLVSIGIVAVGERDAYKIIGYGLGGAAAIEAFVLAYSLWVNNQAVTT